MMGSLAHLIGVRVEKEACTGVYVISEGTEDGKTRCSKRGSNGERNEARSTVRSGKNRLRVTKVGVNAHNCGGVSW